MPAGEFVIGRSSSCHLALDDALVSRRHAVIHVGEEEVVVEDLGSRNGVVVNGERVEGQRKLQHLDRVSIGSQEMVVLEQGRQMRDRPTSQLVACERCGLPIDLETGRCPGCGAAAPGKRTLAGQTVEMSDPEEQTAAGFGVVAGIAEKALGMGRAQEAERVLGHHLDGLLLMAVQGREISDERADAATGLTMRLAEALGSARWVEWLFRFHAAREQLMSADLIDRLHEVVRKARYSDPKPVRAYLQAMQQRSTQWSAAERFRLKRLEALERVVSA